MSRFCFLLLGAVLAPSIALSQQGEGTDPAAEFYNVKGGTTIREEVLKAPVHKKGLNLNQIASCNVIDQLSWVFRKTERQSRFLARDKLRLSTQDRFSYWSIHQVMDRKGYISYVFRRPLPGGRVESIVTKEASYNRIIDSGGMRKIVDARDLKNMIGRAALTFFAENGNRVEFHPGFAGQSTLVVFYTGQTPPLFLRNLRCARGDLDGNDPFAPESDSSGGGDAQSSDGG